MRLVGLLLFVGLLPALVSAAPDCSSLPTLLRNLNDGTFPLGMSACDYLQSEQGLSCCLYANRDNLPPPAAPSAVRPPTAPVADYEVIGPFTPPPLCSESTLALTCSGANGVKIHIDSARFGRTDSDTCSMGIVNGAELAVTNCDADVLIPVRDRCEGRDECTLTASTRNFNDPCVGTNKYLVVKYSCIPNYASTVLALQAPAAEAEPTLIQTGVLLTPEEAFSTCGAAFQACSGFVPQAPIPPSPPTEEPSAPEHSPTGSNPPPANHPPSNPPANHSPSNPPPSNPPPQSNPPPHASSSGRHSNVPGTHVTTPVGTGPHVVPHPSKPTAVKKQVVQVSLKFKGHSNKPHFGRDVVAALIAALNLYPDEMVVLNEQKSSFLQEEGSQMENKAQDVQKALIGVESESNPTTTVTVGFVADTPERALALAAQLQDEWTKFLAGESSRLTGVNFELPVDSMSKSSSASLTTVYECPDGSTSSDSTCGTNEQSVVSSSSGTSATTTKSSAGALLPSLFTLFVSLCIARLL